MLTKRLDEKRAGGREERVVDCRSTEIDPRNDSHAAPIVAYHGDLEIGPRLLEIRKRHQPFQSSARYRRAMRREQPVYIGDVRHREASSPVAVLRSTSATSRPSCP